MRRIISKLSVGLSLSLALMTGCGGLLAGAKPTSSCTEQSIAYAIHFANQFNTHLQEAKVALENLRAIGRKTNPHGANCKSEYEDLRRLVDEMYSATGLITLVYDELGRSSCAQLYQVREQELTAFELKEVDPFRSMVKQKTAECDIFLNLLSQEQ